MKNKIFSLLLLLCLSIAMLASCGVCQHADANGDLKCDKCGAAVPCTVHADADHDLKCDKCGGPIACTEHADANHDLKCDWCKTAVPCTEHADADHNQKCDYCDAFVKCTHEYASADRVCDWCGAPLGNEYTGPDTTPGDLSDIIGK